MIQFSCTRCGKELSAEPQMAGRRGRCNGCNTLLLIPQADGSDTHLGMEAIREKASSEFNARASANPLSVRKSQTDIPPGDCPVCGRALILHAVVCTTCGYDMRTRQRLTVVVEKSSVPLKRGLFTFLRKKR